MAGNDASAELRAYLASLAGNEASVEPFELLDVADGDASEPAGACAAAPHTPASQEASAPHCVGNIAGASAPSADLAPSGSGTRSWPALPFALPDKAASRDAPESAYLSAAAQPARAARDASQGMTTASDRMAADDGAVARAGAGALAERPLGTALAERALKESLLLVATEAG